MEALQKHHVQGKSSGRENGTGLARLKLIKFSGIRTGLARLKLITLVELERD